MKKLLVTLVLLTGFAALANAEVKLETLNWLDYDQYLTTNTAPVINNYGGQFAITRAYVTLQGDIGKDILGGSWKARITLDLANAQFNAPSFATNTDGTVKSYSLPGCAPIKYAYVDYKVMGLNEAVVTFGLLKTQFGNIANWEYPMPWKDATEQYSAVTPTASADYGIAVSGKALPLEGMTKNLLSYSVQLLNGEGYKKIWGNTSDKLNSQFNIMGTLWVTPLDGISIGGSYRNNSGAGTSFDTGYALMASVKDVMDIPVDFLFQYIRKDVYAMNDDNTPKGTNIGEVISTTVGFNVTKLLGIDFGVSPYVRYDLVNEDFGKVNDTKKSKFYNYQVFYGGINLQPIKNMQIKPFIGYNLVTLVTEIKCEFEYKLNFSIWQ